MNPRRRRLGTDEPRDLADAVEELRGEDDGRVPLDRDLAEHLEVAQLQRDRVLDDHVGRLGELAGAERLALGRDDLGPLLALGLGLAGHRPLHRLGQLDVLELHELTTSTPQRSLVTSRMSLIDSFSVSVWLST